MLVLTTLLVLAGQFPALNVTLPCYPHHGWLIQDAPAHIALDGMKLLMPDIKYAKPCSSDVKAPCVGHVSSDVAQQHQIAERDHATLLIGNLIA
ncbi:MAG TPA: hypothetical protein VNZ27_04930 [Rhodanobacter sp.]|nr:hypothetical protein [Rhodanobacter sp.]